MSRKHNKVQKQITPQKQNVTPQIATTEMGRTGLKRFGGDIYEEHLRQLQAYDQRIRIFKEMSENDPVIGAILFAIDMLIRQVPWRVQAGGMTPQDEEAKEFLETCMGDMSHSWEDTISEILSMLQYGFCIPGEALITTGDGQYKQIKNVQEGDLVLTHKGRARKVINVSSKKAKDILKFKIQGSPFPVRMTSNHCVLTQRGWIAAEEIAKGDELCRPIPQMKKGGDYRSGWLVGLYLAEGSRDQGRTRITWTIHQKELKEVKKQADEWLKDYGIQKAENVRRLVANGEAPSMIARKYGYGYNSVVAWLNGREARGDRALGYMHKEDKGAVVQVSNPRMREMIDEWVEGNNAYDKCLKKFPTDREFAMGILEGWAYGDGHKESTVNGDVYTVVTVSEHLVMQMQLLAGAFDYLGSIVKRKGSGKCTAPGAKPTTMNPDYYILRLSNQIEFDHRDEKYWKRYNDIKLRREHGETWQQIANDYGVTIHAVHNVLNPQRKSPKRLHKRQLRIDKTGIWHKVEKIEKQYYDNTVYDLAVEEDHSFLVNNMVVHNSYHEIVYKRREGDHRDPSKRSKHNDGRIGWRKLPIRAQDTLEHWEFDEEGGIRGMYQMPPPDYQTRFVPIEKALLFRTSIHKNNPQGRSVLRTAYKPWYFKKRMETIEAIGLERDLAGFPIAYVPVEWTGANADANQKAAYNAMKELVTNIKRDEQEGAVLPLIYDEEGNQLVKLELLASGGKRQFDTDKIINRYDQRIAMTVLADFILLGSKEVGSYALSSDKTELFAVALGAWLDMIAAVFNRHAIPRLFQLNGFSLEKLPELEHGDIEKPNLEELGKYITALSGAGVPLFPDEDLENHLRGLASLPEKQEEDDFKMYGTSEEFGTEEFTSGPTTKDIKDSTWMTVNEKRKAFGLEPITGGDAIYLPYSEIPAVEIEEGEEE